MRMEHSILKRATLPAFMVLFFSGCAVGPDYRPPEAPNVKTYTSEGLPSETTGGAPGTASPYQRFNPGKDIPAEWWSLFQSDQLDQVIREALGRNPTLAAAQATLLQAQENLRAVAGSALFPSVDAKAGASRQKISGAAFGQPDSNFSPFTVTV
jgi:outer membrane protein TolC